MGGWSRLCCCCCCWWWKNWKWFGVCVKLNIKFVVGELDINGTVVVLTGFWLDKSTWRDKRELKSSKDDVGEKAMEWENCEANDDDGERQWVIGELVSLNLDENVISIGADWNGRLCGSSNWYYKV